MKKENYSKFAGTSYAVTAICTFPTLFLFGNPLYHASGAITGIYANFIDRKCTLPFMELINKPEVRENGLYKRFEEANPILGKHPTMRQYKKRGLIKGMIGCVLWTILPPLSYGYLASSPFIYKNNTWATKNLEKDLEMEVAINETEGEK